MKRRLLYRIWTFLFAFLSGLKISLIGQLGANEILAVLGSVSLKSWKKLYIDVPDAKRVNIFYLFLLISQITSDLINHSSSLNMIRGLANIVFAVIVTNFLIKLLWQGQKNIIFYFIGSILTTLTWKVTDVEDIGYENYECI